ncbi:MAG: enoyl-CoA hydratase [Deltaproteobacteria bacterium]
MGTDVRTELEDGVFTVTLDRPQKKNALTLAMYEGLVDAYTKASEDPAVRVVLLRGEGGTFTAGNDLMDFMQDPPKDDDSPVARFLKVLVSFAKPAVAAVEGHAIGLGSTLLLHTDLVYAAADAKFRLPFVNLGLVPEGASSYLLPRTAGWRLTAELVYFGEPFDAETAQRAGLVNRIVAPGEVVAVATERAQALAKKPIGALMDAKRLLLAGQRDATEGALRREGEIFTSRLTSPEAMEAFTAFFERRDPDFTMFPAG